VRLAPGDAVLVDRRLRQSTHPNRGAERRDGVILAFTPSWHTLPAEVRALLIQDPALPPAGETPARPWCRRLLPPRSDERGDDRADAAGEGREERP